MTENAKNSNEFEPTLLDVLEAVQKGFARLETGQVILVEGQQNLREVLNERTEEIKKDVSKVQNRIEDVVDILEKASKKMPSLDVTQLLYRK